MHLILTHEQADFDAIASLLGAHLLNDAAIPVLPRKLNRNVSAFLTLYGMEFPFKEHGELPRSKVESVTLVDTQSLISQKGVNNETLIRVIDHHPRKDGIPSAWLVSCEAVGATSTILTDGLRDHQTPLSSLQATLLTLGIYEDTGSLTYSRTTPKDLQAAAFLLEQGASLSIVNDFLNHPLSLKQQELYDQLKEDIQYIDVNGHTIALVCGKANQMDEELSSVAHKLRDLLDPDALIMVIETKGGLQLIARSTSDNIDVSKIASSFGGGGHERAAAALIKDRDIDSVCEDLILNFSLHVKPATFVGQIMSKLPKMFSPDTSVEEALESMRRYGYEGFPVVEDYQVIGLLTRRAVDRAVSHKLNLPVKSLMEAGNYTIGPSDSIEVLQDLMTETGWGQIPVYDGQLNQIVGIVTRTDLLKTLGKNELQKGRLNLTEKLISALPEERLWLLDVIAKEAFSLYFSLFIVGGFVRDLLLNRKSMDFDLVVEGDATILAESISKKFGGRVTRHSKFGTAKWHFNDEMIQKLNPAGDQTNFQTVFKSVDLVSARTEFYTYPSALPMVERGSIKLDLHRRDFTINTLALRLDGTHYGELHDYWGGLEDLQSETIRVLHSLSFVDDPTRILRAIRFEKRYGFRIEQRTLELLVEAENLLEQLSGERIRTEIDLMMIEENAVDIFSRLEKLDLLAVIDSALTWDDWLAERIRKLHSFNFDGFEDLRSNTPLQDLQRIISYSLFLIRCSTVEINSVVKRLRIPSNLENIIRESQYLYTTRTNLENAKPSEYVEWIEKVSDPARISLILATDDHQLQSAIERYQKEWRFVNPITDGNDLREMKLPPGPMYKSILTELRNFWLDGEITNQDQEAEFLRKIINEHEISN